MKTGGSTQVLIKVIRSNGYDQGQKIKWQGKGQQVNQVDRVSGSLRGPWVWDAGRRADPERQKRCRSLSL